MLFNAKTIKYFEYNPSPRLIVYITRIIKKYWKFDLITKLLIVVILFILTDRVYSPQYNLYFLAILAITNYRFKLWYFYLLEIPSFIQGMFMFYIKNSGFYSQLIMLVKYIALILILIDVIKRNKVNLILKNNFK